MNAQQAFDLTRSEAQKTALGQAFISIQNAAKSGTTSIAIEVPELAREYVRKELLARGYEAWYSGANVVAKWGPT